MSELIFPIKDNYNITSFFGMRSAPVLGATSNHKGIDISVPAGTEIFAAHTAQVTAAGYDAVRGKYITLEDSSGIKTLYQHLSSIMVTIGQKVKQGDKIALSGNSGLGTGPHLHFETSVDGRAVDPLIFFNKSSGVTKLDFNTELTDILEVIKEYWWAVAGGILLLGIFKRHN